MHAKNKYSVGWDDIKVIHAYLCKHALHFMVVHCVGSVCSVGRLLGVL